MKNKVVINEQEFWAESETPLRNLLEEYGFDFPCGGTGRCGKCRVKCKDLPVTEKDRRFLTDGAIEEGWRIACDKSVDGEYVIECPAPARPPKARELSSCNIIASVEAEQIKIGISDDEIAEEVCVKNPVCNGDMTALGKEYGENPTKVTNALRAVLAKESIELFEKYGKAKAETFAIAANGLFARILTGQPLDGGESDFNALGDAFGLPTETVYFLPVINAYIGGDILAETVNYGENNLILDCGEIFTAVSLGKDDNVAVAMWDMTYDEVGVKAVRAAIKTIIPERYSPFVRLYGKYADKIEDVLFAEDLTYSWCEKKLSNAAKVLQGLRFRAKLNKEKSRTSVLNLLMSEEFHKYFAE